MNANLYPPALQNGDEIRIVAPASVVQKSYIDNTTKVLSELGYNITLGKNVFKINHQFAGNDDERTEDFQNALDDLNVKAIFCARGGYGSIRIINKLNFTVLKEKPKWLVGFSDITAFHSYMNCRLNLPTLHAQMPVNFSDKYFMENLGRLNQMLNGIRPVLFINQSKLNRQGKSAGVLIGGNLSILYSLQSTPYEVDTRNKILFIEDVGEQLYHLDRIMQNFKLSGKLDSLKGLIVGSFTDMKDKKRPFGKTAYEIILDAVKKYRFPVVFDFPAGHTQNNVPFILGSEVELHVQKNRSTVKYL
ncbi:MAG: LD-carboxypeptidase [Bacteroidales bacterium]|nr:LD-carboxypeptidase [Bacteroidales bacterium]